MADNANLKQIVDVLDQLADDTSVPRNIRRGANDAKEKLLRQDEALDVKAASAIFILDELANDPTFLCTAHPYLEYHQSTRDG